MSYDGAAFELTAAKNWPQRMPEKGRLKLLFVPTTRAVRNIESISDITFSGLWNRTVFGSCTSEWLKTYVILLSRTLHFSCEQAARILRGMDDSASRVECCMLLFSRIW